MLRSQPFYLSDFSLGFSHVILARYLRLVKMNLEEIPNKGGELCYLTAEFSVLKSMSEGTQPYSFFVSGPQEEVNHRITESQNSRGWKGPLWVI